MSATYYIIVLLMGIFFVHALVDRSFEKAWIDVIKSYLMFVFLLSAGLCSMWLLLKVIPRALGIPYLGG